MSPPINAGAPGDEITRGNQPKHRTATTQARYGDSSPSADTAAGLRRRRAASWRLPVLDTGHADPIRPYRGRCGDYGAAVIHLDDHGLTAYPDADGLRAMWRVGGRDRAVAQRVATCWAVA